MLVGTHSPDTCAYAVPALRDKALSALKRRDEVAKKLGITIQGAWTNMPGHTMYFICDAPNAHVVNQMAVELQLMEWNTMVVIPVITFDEAQKVLQQRKP
jgi:uncharacterized protein with GYD domain